MRRLDFLATVTKPWAFLLQEEMGFAKSMVFLLWEQNGLPATVPKPWFSVAGRNGCFKNDEQHVMSGKIVAGCSEFCF